MILGPVSGNMPLNNADAILIGETSEDRAGTSVAGVGDTDGDGYDDLLIGAPGFRNEFLSIGVAYLVEGKSY